jgi:ribose transport system substrate-binding protein
MAVTIKEVAERAGVSIATVSHVINKTRYVSPDLAKHVEAIIQETGYNKKIIDKINKLRVGKQSEIALVVPNVTETVFAKLSDTLSKNFEEEGYELSVYLTGDNIQKEKQVLNNVMSNKRIAGLILIPASEVVGKYKKLIKSTLPFICLERSIDDEGVACILSSNFEAVYRGTIHLLKSGHEKIGILLGNKNFLKVKERLDGYKKALQEYNVSFDKSLVIHVDGEGEEKNFLKKFNAESLPSAILAGGNQLTFKLIKYMDELGLECPNDISVIGFGDNEWCEIINPPLTMLTQNIDEMAKKSMEKLQEKIQGDEGLPQLPNVQKVPVEFTIRKSTQIIGRGPFGEKALHPEVLSLTSDEIEAVKNGNFKVGISFHYTGTEWTRLHEQAMKETFQLLGIKLISVMDAHFDPALQNTQLDSLMMQKADAIVSVPVDEEKTTKKFKEISKKTKLILINNMPSGFDADDYVSWISVNERENGQNAGKILGEYFKNMPSAKVAMITHGTPFFATKQRDSAVMQVLTENYPNVRIVASESFFTIDRAYQVCQMIVQQHPDIQGLYVSWDRPALGAIRALEDMGREDIVVVTTDLDQEIAGYMAQNKMVIGLSSQRPFEQGVAVAWATANALLGKRQFKCIGVQPYMVTRRNLRKAWREIIKTPEPEEIKHSEM